MLVAKPQNLVIEKGLAELRKAIIAETRGQIETTNFGANNTGLRDDFHAIEIPAMIFLARKARKIIVSLRRFSVTR
jgi:hypothetical protein